MILINCIWIYIEFVKLFKCFRFTWYMQVYFINRCGAWASENFQHLSTFSLLICLVICVTEHNYVIHFVWRTHAVSTCLIRSNVLVKQSDTGVTLFHNLFFKQVRKERNDSVTEWKGYINQRRGHSGQKRGHRSEGRGHSGQGMGHSSQGMGQKQSEEGPLWTAEGPQRSREGSQQWAERPETSEEGPKRSREGPQWERLHFSHSQKRQKKNI